MKGPRPPRPEPPQSKPSRLEEARRVIEGYADDLREILESLRQRLN